MPGEHAGAAAVHRRQGQRLFYQHENTVYFSDSLPHRIALHADLRIIDKKSDMVENQLHRSTQNRELIELLKLEKSLVYFTTALRSNEVVLEKLLKTDSIKKYPEDDELLEDTIVENKQAIEMANIYSGILSGMMDAFASVISNNLNIVMKVLAVVHDCAFGSDTDFQRLRNEREYIRDAVCSKSVGLLDHCCAVACAERRCCDAVCKIQPVQVKRAEKRAPLRQN